MISSRYISGRFETSIEGKAEFVRPEDMDQGALEGLEDGTDTCLTRFYEIYIYDMIPMILANSVGRRHASQPSKPFARRSLLSGRRP